jgi:hypothetical protein
MGRWCRYARVDVCRKTTVVTTQRSSLMLRIKMLTSGTATPLRGGSKEEKGVMLS